MADVSHFIVNSGLHARYMNPLVPLHSSLAEERWKILCRECLNDVDENLELLLSLPPFIEPANAARLLKGASPKSQTLKWLATADVLVTVHVLLRATKTRRCHHPVYSFGCCLCGAD